MLVGAPALSGAACGWRPVRRHFPQSLLALRALPLLRRSAFTTGVWASVRFAGYFVGTQLTTGMLHKAPRCRHQCLSGFGGFAHAALTAGKPGFDHCRCYVAAHHCSNGSYTTKWNRRGPLTRRFFRQCSLRPSRCQCRCAFRSTCSQLAGSRTAYRQFLATQIRRHELASDSCNLGGVSLSAFQIVSSWRHRSVVTNWLPGSFTSRL